MASARRSSEPTARQRLRLAKKHLERMHAEHPCGACGVCCTAQPVEALSKPADMACTLQRPPKEHTEHPTPSTWYAGGRCSAHGKRPQECRDYFCAYRHGLVGDSYLRRPDRLGLLFDVVPKPPPNILMLSVREVREGALDEPEGQQAMHEIAATGVVLYLSRGEQRFFMGPEDRVNACREWSRRQLPIISR